MYFRILHDEASGATSYLLADLDTRECALVDARGADVPVPQAMLAQHQLHMRWLLHTHEHESRTAADAAALKWLGGTVHRSPLACTTAVTAR